MVQLHTSQQAATSKNAQHELLFTLETPSALNATGASLIRAPILENTMAARQKPGHWRL